MDISTTAVERARLAAIESGLPEDRARFLAADLSTVVTEDAQGPGASSGAEGLLAGPFDLVTASFLHSEVALERTAVLRWAASVLAPGGHLLILSHAAPPPWASAEHRAHHHDLLDPAGELAALDLSPEEFRPILAETRRRTGAGPDGEEAEMEDGIVLLRRAH